MNTPGLQLDYVRLLFYVYFIKIHSVICKSFCTLNCFVDHSMVTELLLSSFHDSK